MADELDLDQLDSDLEKENKAEKRIKDLSEKVRLTSEERDEKAKLLQEKEDKISALEKETAFFNSFGDVIAKPEYANAAQYRDKIKAKVLQGYTIEDAALSVLNAEGKFNPPKPQVEVQNPAGGSAVTQPVTGEKTLSELTRDEKRQKLIEAEARGDISVT